LRGRRAGFSFFRREVDSSFIRTGKKESILPSTHKEGRGARKSAATISNIGELPRSISGFEQRGPPCSHFLIERKKRGGGKRKKEDCPIEQGGKTMISPGEVKKNAFGRRGGEGRVTPCIVGGRGGHSPSSRKGGNPGKRKRGRSCFIITKTPIRRANAPKKFLLQSGERSSGP